MKRELVAFAVIALAVAGLGARYERQQSRTLDPMQTPGLLCDVAAAVKHRPATVRWYRACLDDMAERMANRPAKQSDSGA